MKFAFIGRFRPDIEDQRLAIHDSYNEHLRQHPTPINFGGPIYDEADTRVGYVWIFEAADREAALRFLQHSPYELAGLYESAEVHEIRPEVGRLA